MLFYGEFLRKEILESYQCKSEAWMMTEYDERVLDYQKINYGNYIVERKGDGGLQGQVLKVNTLPLQLVVFISSISKRIMNNFIHAIDGFYTSIVHYTHCDSCLYWEQTLGNFRWSAISWWKFTSR